jgi:hypothetical protein
MRQIILEALVRLGQLTSILNMAANTEIHRKGTDDGWHGEISQDGQFPPEAGRYHMYIGEW